MGANGPHAGAFNNQSHKDKGAITIAIYCFFPPINDAVAVNWWRVGS